jgi:hypothetical protein
MITNELSKYFEMARNLAQDANKPIYQDLEGNEIKENWLIIYDDDKPITPADIFTDNRFSHALLAKDGCYGGRYYTRQLKTDKEGKILPRKVYRTEVYYHRKWARKDELVTDVTFDVIGLKRKTTHLPCGVLINNIQFITE